MAIMIDFLMFLLVVQVYSNWVSKMHTEKAERAVIKLKTHYNTIMSGARFFGFPLVVLDSRVLLAEAPPVVLLASKYAVSF